MLILNGSTPRIPVLMVDATDDETAETGLTVTVQISKNGGAFATTTNSPTEVANGWYYVALTATETNTDGPIMVRATATGADEWRDYHQVYSTIGANVVSYTSGQAPLQPTVSGRTLDVTATGGAGIDWGNVENPTTVVGLTGTTVKTATDVETDTQDIQSRLPAALTAGGNIKADALAISGDTVAADNAESFFDGTGYAGTNNVIPTVTSVTNGVTVTTNNDKTGYALTAGERNSVADAFLNRDMSTGTDSGSPTVRTVRQALRFLRNKWSISAGTLTVTKEDDTTESWTASVTTAASNPVDSVDPA